MPASQIEEPDPREGRKEPATQSNLDFTFQSKQDHISILAHFTHVTLYINPPPQPPIPPRKENETL